MTISLGHLILLGVGLTERQDLSLDRDGVTADVVEGQEAQRAATLHAGITLPGHGPPQCYVIQQETNFLFSGFLYTNLLF